MKKNQKLINKLGYEFSDESLLELALSHRSVGIHNNERLEFLGDSLLSVIISEALFRRFPQAREGDLSRLRSALVKGATLSEIAREFQLGDYLNLGEGELKSGGCRRASILADAVESLIGAIYLDSDMTTCRQCVMAWFSSRFDALSIDSHEKDPKTRLQEYLQQKKQPLPQYNIVESKGNDHDKTFIIECYIGRAHAATQAQSSSKKMAEKLAAEKMLNVLGESFSDKE